MRVMDDTDDAAGDVDALRVLEQLVERAADAGLVRGGEIDHLRRAVERLRGLATDWHGDDVAAILETAPGGAA
jgi:hypothetical protein